MSEIKTVLALCLLMMAGCNFHVDDTVYFDITVTNKLYSPIEVFIDGGKAGEVEASGTARFTIEGTIEDLSDYSDNDVYWTEVTVSARSISTAERSRQSISDAKTLRVYDDRINDVEFDYHDFDASIREGELVFNFSFQNRTDYPLLVMVNGVTLVEELPPQSVLPAYASLECYYIDNEGIGKAKASISAIAMQGKERVLSEEQEMTVYNNKVESVTFEDHDFDF